MTKAKKPVDPTTMPGFSIYDNTLQRFFVNDAYFYLRNKYQVHWYRKRLMANAINKLNLVDWRHRDLSKVRALSNAFDKHVLQARTVFTPVKNIPGFAARVTVTPDTSFTIWNAENGEILLPDNIKYKETTKMVNFTDWQYVNVLTGGHPATLIDSLHLLPLEIDDKSPHYGKKICFTGKSSLQRETLEYLTLVFGATYQAAASGQTNYLVVPAGGATRLTGKLKLVAERNKTVSEDKKTKIIEEADFINLLPDLDNSIDLTQFII